MAGLLVLRLGTALYGQNQIILRCTLSGCTEPLGLYEFDGFTFQQVATTQADANGVFEFKLPKSSARFYQIGLGSDRIRTVILGEEKLVEIQGSCDNIRQAVVKGSPINEHYERTRELVSKFNNEAGQLLRSFGSTTDSGELQSLIQRMAVIDKHKLVALDSLTKINPLLGRVMALNAYQSYPANNQNRYPDEIQYFAGEFFSKVDLSDAGYDHLLWFYEAVKTYTQVLSTVGLPEEMVQGYLDSLLVRIPEGSHARQQALAAIVGSMQARKNPLFVPYAEQFIAEYSAKAPQSAAMVGGILERGKRLMNGSPAPEFSQMTPDSTQLNVKELRGKYVLLDFWASWCGPCRRENPNVVRMYDKYKDKGFEILGISLDQSRENWLKAIEADKLTWKHVSDLKGWSNEVGRLYEVTSIPKTFLLDPQGRIIARDLRGASLEQKLAELLGSEPTPNDQ